MKADDRTGRKLLASELRHTLASLKRNGMRPRLAILLVRTADDQAHGSMLAANGMSSDDLTYAFKALLSRASKIADPIEPPKTQLQRARAERDRLGMIFPILAEAKDELKRALDEAQNPPPEGKADGSMGEIAWKQASSIAKHASDLCIALLFGNGKDPQL